ncbi:MAG: hypothetical protein ACE5H1_10455, partial [Thermodesulfobacteriota bacterium]
SRNRLKNKNHQVFTAQYAIINDVAHNYAMLTYYTDKVNQVKQLEDMGFNTIEMYDTYGNMLNLDSDDKDSAWIYYVAKKVDQKNGKWSEYIFGASKLKIWLYFCVFCVFILI